MRVTSLLRALLGLKSTQVTTVSFDAQGLVAGVRPTWQRPRCSRCGRPGRGYDRQRDRRWRHLDLAGMRLELSYDIRRVDCRHCRAVVVEQVPWADPGSWFTRPFEDQVGYLAQRCDQSTVSRQMRVAWETVGRIVQRVVARCQDEDPLDGLTIIGVDELSYRRHHEYVTVVVDHVRGCVVWASPGKNAETLLAFFEELGPERAGNLEAVTIDMSAAYIKAVTDASPQAQIIFDRFHVQRLAHDALDEVRRAEVREAIGQDERRGIKNTRWALQKNPWNLTRFEFERLSRLPKANRKLYRAYMLKEALIPCDVGLEARKEPILSAALPSFKEASIRLTPFAARTLSYSALEVALAKNSIQIDDAKFPLPGASRLVLRGGALADIKAIEKALNTSGLFDSAKASYDAESTEIHVVVHVLPNPSMHDKVAAAIEALDGKATLADVIWGPQPIPAKI